MIDEECVVEDVEDIDHFESNGVRYINYGGQLFMLTEAINHDRCLGYVWNNQYSTETYAFRCEGGAKEVCRFVRFRKDVL